MRSLHAVVRELRWSDARASAVRFFVHALVASVAWIFAVLVVARLVPIEQVLRIAAFGVPAVFAAVAVAWAVSRPSSAALMRTADLRLDLKERLSTAWERRLTDGPMDGALRRDALERAARVQLSRAYPVGLGRRELLVTAAFLIAAVALLLLPNPMDQVLAQRNADKAAQARAANSITATQKKLASSSKAPVDPQVQQVLQDAKAKIAAAPDPRTALQYITPAEQKLLQLSDPGTPARAATAQNLANNLAATNAGRPASQALSASPSQGAQSLRQLSNSLPNLSAQDRAQLAQALAQAAQQAKDPQMQASLQNASTALAAGDTAAAAAALNDVASQLDSLQQQESNDQEIAAAINGLEASRQQLANQANADSQSSSSSAQAGTSPGTGASNAAGNGNGNGNANNPGGGTGNGNGSGATGSGNGNGGTGGNGGSGSGAGSGSSAASTEKVYVPAPPVPGQTENDPTPLGPGQDVPLTPYTQVIQAYQQVALDATDQSLIPGSESDLIRQYFSSLGETGGGQ